MVEWIAAALVLVSVGLYPRLPLAGALYGIAASSLWIAVGLMTGLQGLVALNLALLGINTWNAWRYS
ncbi:MAG: hypothetical protein GEU78_08015 [Actinobacteria bacterium]|nr:hypothetical protein [Actinomycetota bacterium]